MKAIKIKNEKTRIETAMQMVVMDAMEKGHTNKDELISYMKSKVFENSVKSYSDMMK